VFMLVETRLGIALVKKISQYVYSSWVESVEGLRQYTDHSPVGPME